ncbi:UbiA prenyltransferase family protein [Aureivirga marina]|uniref:hypothetical protein n=1 Tax=Aureivirga marina TaxID=1182451 RepID=UPI0018CB62A0|nr:hypothetical protein [Aureivirga marina]
MHLFKKLFEFYIYSSLHVSLATFSMTKITLISNGISDNWIPIFVFCSTFISYNFIRDIEFQNVAKHSFLIWFMKRRKNLFLISFVFTIINTIIFFSPFFHWISLLVLIPFALMTAFYAIPVIKINNKVYNLRNIPFLKIFTISISWAGITVLFPISNFHFSFSLDVWLDFFQRILFVLIITLPFDIRDLKHDDISLQTFPQKIGIRNTKLVGVFFAILFCFLQFLHSYEFDKFSLINYIIIAVSALFLIKSSEKQSKFYASFFVEALPIVWLILLLLL